MKSMAKSSVIKIRLVNAPQGISAQVGPWETQIKQENPEQTKERVQAMMIIALLILHVNVKPDTFAEKHP
jgi:hypothetical protein